MLKSFVPDLVTSSVISEQIFFHNTHLSSDKNTFELIILENDTSLTQMNELAGVALTEITGISMIF